MANMQERLNAAVDMAEVDTGLLHEIVHGDINTIVTTEGGQVPSVAKVINDINVDIEANATLLHDIVHGDATTVVVTENGEIPSAAKTVSEIREYIQSGTDDLVSQAKEAARQAKAWAAKTNGAVEDFDYSAKHYAEVAQEIASDMSKKSDTLEGYGIVDGVAYELVQEDKVVLKILYPETLTFTVI